MRQQQEPKDIRCDVIKVYDESISQDGRSSSALRAVRWVVNGKPTQPRLERRDFWNTEQGEKKMGKTKGLTLSDVRFVADNAEDILADMSGQPKRQEKDPDAFPG